MPQQSAPLCRSISLFPWAALEFHSRQLLKIIIIFFASVVHHSAAVVESSGGPS